MTVTIGVDLGQSVDPTALVVLESYAPEPAHIEDKPEDRHLIRWLQKVPLGTSYTEVVEKIATIAQDAGSYGRPTIVLDATGVGRPVVDMLRKRTSIQMRAVTFTGASAETQTGPYGYRVPKRDLATALEITLENRLLDGVPDCPLIEDLNAELEHFDFSFNDRGHKTFDGVEGSHDDLVAALALALWWARRNGVKQWFVPR